MARQAEGLPALTGMRGFAACWVAAGHLLLSVPSTFPVHTFFGVITLNVQVPVELFFVLSGFIMMHVYGNAKFLGRERWVLRFLAARFSRLYPAYVAAMILLEGPRWLGGWMSGTEVSASFSFYQLVVNLLLVQNWGVVIPSIVPPEWSVSVEVFAYIIVFPFFVRIFVVQKSGLGHLLTALACLGGLAWTGWPRQEQWLWVVTLEFILGASCYGLRRAAGAVVKKWARFNDVVFVLMLAGLALHLSQHPLSRIMVAASLGLWILGLSYGRCGMGRLFSSRFFVYLGVISYSLYVVHVPAYCYGWKIASLSPALVSGESGTYVGALLVYGLAILSAALLYHGVEAPSRGYLRKKFDGWLDRDGSRASVGETAVEPVPNNLSHSD